MICANFEGTEKKLEIILFQPQANLRDNADQKWRRITEASGSQILSRIRNGFMDAYILSESSLFVWDHAFLLITCGKTSLINAIPAILSVISQDAIAYLIYERKNFQFPEEQPSDFEEDVARLLPHFPGKSYRLGPANADHLHLFYYAHPAVRFEPGASLQLLMSELNPKITNDFRSHNAQAPGKIAAERQFSAILPPALHCDDYHFEPYGYSLNGIQRNCYYTLHVTPQPEHSYASFATNAVCSDDLTVVNAVLSLFMPRIFTLVVAAAADRFQGLPQGFYRDFPAYRATAISLCLSDHGYRIACLNYSQTP